MNAPNHDNGDNDKELVFNRTQNMCYEKWLDEDTQKKGTTNEWNFNQRATIMLKMTPNANRILDYEYHWIQIKENQKKKKHFIVL